MTATDVRPPVPRRMRALPLDKHGRPVPWFVAWIDGQPDHRIIAPGRIERAVKFGCCWLCGEQLGSWLAFVIGPMCAVNRVTAEPPSHRDCAVYSAQVCPFLTTPNMVRRESRTPDGVVEPAGVMLRRNPGVAVVWIARSYEMFAPPDGGILFRVGDPHEVLWYAHGRPATAEEARASIDTGLPALQEIAGQDGPDAVQELTARTAAALALLPGGTP